MGNSTSKKSQKKELSKEVFEKLSSAISPYKGKLKEKKTLGRLKKISKRVAEDIVKAEDKRKPRPSKPRKKSSKETAPAES